MAAKKPKLGYHHGDLKNALVTAAVRLIEKRKDTAFTVRELAVEAAVSHAAAYRHFAGKGDILAAVAEAGFARLQASFVAAARAHPTSIGDELHALGVAYVTFAVEHTGYFRTMFHSDLGDHTAFPGLAAVSRAAFDSLFSAVSRGAAAGTFVQRPAIELAVMAWSSVHGLASLIIDGRMHNPHGPTASAQELGRIVNDLLLVGLLPRALGERPAQRPGRAQPG